MAMLRMLRMDHGRAERREVGSWRSKFRQHVKLGSTSRGSHRRECDLRILLHLVSLLFHRDAVELLLLLMLLAHEGTGPPVHLVAVWRGRDMARRRIVLLPVELEVFGLMWLRHGRLVHRLRNVPS